MNLSRRFKVRIHSPSRENSKIPRRCSRLLVLHALGGDEQVAIRQDGDAFGIERLRAAPQMNQARRLEPERVVVDAQREHPGAVARVADRQQFAVGAEGDAGEPAGAENTQCREVVLRRQIELVENGIRWRRAATGAECGNDDGADDVRMGWFTFTGP